MTAPLRKAEGLLSPTSAADWLDVGRTTVYALMAAGDLPYLRVGSHRRIRVADLEAYAEQQLRALDPPKRRHLRRA